MTSISSQLASRTVTNALAPSEGPKAVSLALPFASSSVLDLDCALLVSQGFMQSVQAIYVDNSGNASAVSIAVQGGQTVTVPPLSQAYLPIVSAVPARFEFTSAGGVTVPIQLLNVPMPALVWSTSGGGAALPVIGGLMQVQDPILETAISGGLMQSQLVAIAGGTTATPLACDASGRLLVQTSEPGVLATHSLVTVASVSTALMAANASRQYLYVKAPETADLWINPRGGASSVGGADCMKIPQGTFYESNNFVTSSAITYFCVTAALQVTAFDA